MPGGIEARISGDDANVNAERVVDRALEQLKPALADAAALLTFEASISMARTSQVHARTRDSPGGRAVVEPGDVSILVTMTPQGDNPEDTCEIWLEDRPSGAVDSHWRRPARAVRLEQVPEGVAG